MVCMPIFEAHRGQGRHIQHPPGLHIETLYQKQHQQTLDNSASQIAQGERYVSLIFTVPAVVTVPGTQAFREFFFNL